MSNSERPKGSPPNRFAFSSDAFPSHLDNRERARLWQEMGEELYGSLAVSYADDLPFSASVSFARFGDVEMGEFGGTLTEMARSRKNILTDGRDEFFLGTTFGTNGILCRQNGKEATVDPNASVLLSTTEIALAQAQPGTTWHSVVIPREKLSELVRHPDDLLAKAIDPDLPSARLLQRYLAILQEPQGFEDEPALSEHIGQTLTDLVALMLGANREAAELAKTRGRRSARLEAILASIKSRCRDPGFSETALAQDLGLSPRYIRDLLFETGTTFSERVLELRLQHAKSMLSDRRCNSLKIGDIAYGCGFNEVSYFNRCFRRRFGAAPSHFRR
ncbi:AraC family transcriptional regulator [Methyloligella solikamskensis]|uniref:AraC family transcriptional regulator n=1 Tax=Methyloligella solikamskensis TaxID=1177756 RepID=A0ABW3J850_9HYPH